MLFPLVYRLRGTDVLGNLVGVETVLGLEGVDEAGVLLLGELGGGALVDLLLPGLGLGLALQVEHAGLGGLGDVLAVGDLEEGCGERKVSTAVTAWRGKVVRLRMECDSGRDVP